MTILDKIVKYKKEEIELFQLRKNKLFFKNSDLFRSSTNSVFDAISKNKQRAVISEFKRKSPSKGDIGLNVNLKRQTDFYVENGATAISVLTDSHFFGGLNQDLINLRSNHPNIPILRKDFIVDEIQIYESKSIGADVILLIAAVLSKSQIKEYTELANELGLEVLLELHAEEELEKVSALNRLIGINNRNLKTFEVDFEHSKRMVSQLPKDALKVSESGIYTIEDIELLRSFDFDAFLIGESLMKGGVTDSLLTKIVS